MEEELKKTGKYIEELEKRLKEFEKKEKFLNEQSKALAEANANAAILMAEIEEKNVALGKAKNEIEEAERKEEKLNKELKKKIELVEKFNKIAVKRELRHIELKAEINCLLEKLGGKPFYSSGHITEKTREHVNKMLAKK